MRSSSVDFYEGLDVSDDGAEYQAMQDSPHVGENKNDAEYVAPVAQDALVAIHQLNDEPRELAVADGGLSAEEIEDYIHREAMREVKHYFKTYSTPDGAFQFFEDLIIYFNSGKFEISADPTFSREEMLYALGVYGGGFGFYYVLAELAAGASVLEALWGGMKFGFQYWFFYILDGEFEVDWVSARETIPNIAAVCFLMGVICYLLDTIPDLGHAYFTSAEPELNDNLKKEMKKIMRKNVGEALGVTVGTAGWMLPYYLPIEGVPGLIIKGVGEGVVSNLFALPFVYHSASQDIREEVESGKRQPKTRAQEIEEANKPRVSFCTKASNYFRSWIFTEEKVKVPEANPNRQQLLSDEERAEQGAFEEEYKVPSASRSQSASKSKRGIVQEIEFGSSSKKALSAPAAQGYTR
ncbi:MAG: hypothetical protein P4M14_08570 [Gammaproteobacteria bacterium]|nr:hypothetical protein [Gammaproteobacteria bacterium]